MPSPLWDRHPRVLQAGPVARKSRGKEQYANSLARHGDNLPGGSLTLGSGATVKRTPNV